MDNSIVIDGKSWDEAHPFIVAEVGINHNGDMELASDCIAAAAEAGADAVKFQNYHTEDFISDRNLKFSYQSQGRKITEAQFDMFKRYELSAKQLGFLKSQCDKHGVNFHSTPTSVRGIDELVAVNCSVLKNGSDYLTHLGLIKAMAETGLPTVLSTGMATMSEIDQAVRVFRDSANSSLLLLHCTSAYPTPVEQANLARIETLKSAFDVAVGFSDHTSGITAAIASVVIGVCWIEKHFTLDKNLPGPDHWFSMDPDELKHLVTSVREAEVIKGTSQIEPTIAEEASRRDFRLSCVALNDMQSGAVLGPADIGFRRPGPGFPPVNADIFIGNQLRNPIKAGDVFTLDHIIKKQE